MKVKLIKYSLVFAALIAVASAFAFSVKAPVTKTASEEKGITFIEQDWSKALAEAKENKKLVFLDIYATWCGPCKMLKRNTFTDEAAGKFFNENFINVSVDGEAGVGPELAKKFGLTGYPTLVITDAEGNAISQFDGYVDASYLIYFAKEALKKKS